MNCPVCGTAYIEIYEMGHVTPVSEVANCACSWTATPAARTTAASLIGLCTGCQDVIPARMLEDVGSDLLCPECFNQVEVPDPTELISDLRALEQELRPQT